MDKRQFIEILEQGASSYESKVECCQFFIDNYPVKAITNGMNPFGKGWTKLEGIKISTGTRGQLDYAFKQLQRRIGELRSFKTAKYG